MSALRSLFAQREARMALAIWAIIPTIFLFFTITLAVDPSTQLNKLRLGVAVLDKGVQTPQGQAVIATQLLNGLHQQAPFEIVQFGTEAELRDAVLGRKVSGGIIFPANMTQDLQTKKPVQLQVAKSDGNDPFTNLFMTNTSTQLATNLNAALPGMLGGQPTQPLVTVAYSAVAATADFRFGSIPATLILPIWIATLAFAALLARAADRVRGTSGLRAVDTALAELGIGALGAVIAAAVITLDIALFTWRWNLDYLGLFGFLSLALLASAWLLQGTIRLVGIELGAALGVIALFVQQPVSGAAFPSSFAPEIVRWAEGVAPLRFMVEGMRNLLIGGSTTPDMAIAFAAVAGVGLLLFAAGVALYSLVPGLRRSHQPATSA